MKLPSASTPYVSDETWATEPAGPGRFAATCTSHAATIIFLARVARPGGGAILRVYPTPRRAGFDVHDSEEVRHVYLSTSGSPTNSRCVSAFGNRTRGPRK